jgi:Zn-dependent protease
MQSPDIMKVIFVLIPMILALTVHEYCHAWVASKLGDDTARHMGRLTLNPIAHIDPIGTLLIPAVGLLSNFPFFGWAKPVPINPVLFNRKLRMKTGILLTAIAGPLSNLLFAGLMAVVIGIIGPSAFGDILMGNKGIQVAFVKLAGWSLLINVGLFVFNLIPIPPLDGSKVLAGFLPDRFHAFLDLLNRYSFLLFIGLMLAAYYGQLTFIFYPVMWIINGLSGLVGIDLWLVIRGV